MYVALTLVSFGLAVCALIGALVLVVLSLVKKAHRKRYSKLAGFSFVGMFILFGFGGFFADSGMDEDAVDAGFVDHAEMNEAEKSGFSDPDAWHSYLREAAAMQAADEAAAKAEVERVEREKAEAKAHAELEKDAACRQNVGCYGDKFLAEASTYCPDQIERLAKWDVEWTDGMLDLKFTHYRWNDKEAGVVDFIGDKLKMQNGFGAWQNVVYVCTYATKSRMVLNVAAEPGRL